MHGAESGGSKGLEQQVSRGQNYGSDHFPCSVLRDSPFSFLSAAGGRAVPVERTLHVRASFMHKWRSRPSSMEQNLMEGSRTSEWSGSWRGGRGGPSLLPRRSVALGKWGRGPSLVDEDDGGAYSIVLLLNELTYTLEMTWLKSSW